MWTPRYDVPYVSVFRNSTKAHAWCRSQFGSTFTEMYHMKQRNSRSYEEHGTHCFLIQALRGYERVISATSRHDKMDQWIGIRQMICAVTDVLELWSSTEDFYMSASSTTGHSTVQPPQQDQQERQSHSEQQQQQKSFTFFMTTVLQYALSSHISVFDWMAIRQENRIVDNAAAVDRWWNAISALAVNKHTYTDEGLTKLYKNLWTQNRVVLFTKDAIVYYDQTTVFAQKMLFALFTIAFTLGYVRCIICPPREALPDCQVRIVDDIIRQMYSAI